MEFLQININGIIYAAIQVPEGAKEFKVSHNPAGLEYRTTPSAWVVNLLPEGSYSLPFPCVVGEMTEDMAGQVVDKSLIRPTSKSPGGMSYIDYETRYWSMGTTAIASLLSLCRANGLNPSTTILLKVNN